MQDMLVKLYDLPEMQEALCVCKEKGVEIRRAMTPDLFRVVEWVRGQMGDAVAGECMASFSRMPVACFVATRGAEIVGFACYHATGPEFFGPTCVSSNAQGAGVGKALLLRALHAMRDEGYSYAIIGGVGPQAFYEKCVGATLIHGSNPGIYKDFLGALAAK